MLFTLNLRLTTPSRSTSTNSAKRVRSPLKDKDFIEVIDCTESMDEG